MIDPRFIVRLNDYWGKSSEADATPRSSDGQLLFLMEMVNKMKPLTKYPHGSRIASVHNGSSLFTGDAGGGESNIRRYIIENDYLEAIIQLPNNLFYNTGITTYIWILTNNKAQNRKGKVQLIDASELYKKLRKNLGDKNCELKDEHIATIMDVYKEFQDVEKDDKTDIASKIFDNTDFGYYKVNIERPKRLKAQLCSELIESLRYDKALREPMKWAYEKFGDTLYEDVNTHEKEILKWCEDEELNLKTKQQKTLTSQSLWKKLQKLLESAKLLQQTMGDKIFDDFNCFKSLVDKTLKEQKIKLTSSEKNQILNTISWYDESAVKVIKRIYKFSEQTLLEELEHLGCNESELADFGLYATDKKGEFIEYESDTELRDSENIPLKESIHDYFLREVNPHVKEAWINLDSTKIGYEISFNRYFYQHKPLRNIEDVTADIVALEKESDGLIREILGL